MKITSSLLASLADQLERGGQDVTLRTKRGTSFRCHGVVLALASPLMKDLLAQSLEEDQVVIVDSFSDQDVLDFLNTIYSVTKPHSLPALLQCLRVEVEDDNINTTNFIETALEEEVKYKTDQSKEHEYETDHTPDGQINGCLEFFQEKEELNKIGKIVEFNNLYASKEDSKLLIENYSENEKSHTTKFSKFKKKVFSTCPFCNVQIINPTRHVASKHPDKFDEYKPSVFKSSKRPREWPKQCELCESKLANIWYFNKHIKTHMKDDAPEGNIFCDKCGEGPFSTEPVLKSHIEAHKTERVCTEDDCREVFSNGSNLREHLLFVHKVVRARKIVVASKDFICVQCGKGFTNKHSLSYHTKQTHEKVPGKHVCNVCGKRCQSRAKLEYHVALHSEPTVPCHECKKLFHTQGYLTRHIRSKHTPDNRKRYQCPICQKGFNVKDSIEGHKNWHQGVKPFNCAWCSLKFADKSNLTSHEKRLHPEQFENCEKRLIQVKLG